MQPAFIQLNTMDKVAAAAADPAAWLHSLDEQVVGPVAMKLAAAKLKPQLEPSLKKQGLAWADVEPVTVM